MEHGEDGAKAARFGGYSWRPLRLVDLQAVFELERAGESFDDGVVEVDLSDLQADWRRPDFRPGRMSVGVFAGEVLVAYATVFLGRAEALVHPLHRGRGLGTALARWTWDVARAEGRDRVGQTVSENEHAAEELFRDLGYEPTHTSWILRMELGSGRVAAPPLPVGYRFRPYRPGEDDRCLFALIDTAFAEWRGLTSESMGFENWIARTFGEADQRLVVVLEYGSEIVGVATCHDYGPEAEGWIEQVAVDRSHRGQGLGRALLAECFRRFAERGRLRCGISTDSRTGALSLYEHVGMTVARTYRRWTKSGLSID
jgi:mycothiol synthase